MFLTQLKLLICNFKIRKVKDTRGKIWYLHEDSIRNDVRSYIKKKHGGGLKMLVIILVRSGNYGKSGNRETHVREASANLYKVFSEKVKVKQKWRKVENFCFYFCVIFDRSVKSSVLERRLDARLCFHAILRRLFL